MVHLYRLIIFLCGIVLLPLWLLAILFDFQRARRRSYFSEPAVIDSRESVLVHGASLGEMTVVRKIIPIVREYYPENPIIVSVTSESGYKNITETLNGSISHAVFLPFEFRICIGRMLKLTKPKLIIITETELWPNFILEARRKNIRLLLLNGRISDKTLPSYVRFRNIFGSVVRSFDKIGTQTEEYKKRFIAIGANPEKITVTGNIKEIIDCTPPSDETKKSAKKNIGLGDQHWLFIAASTRPGEEEKILSSFVPLFERMDNLILLLAPRHTKRTIEVEKLIESSGIQHVRRSSINNGLPAGTRVILLDTLGELSMLYKAGEAAFVGGTLVDIGGHNLLEPLSAAIPVVFGFSTHQQKASAAKLLSSGAGHQIKSSDELADFVDQIYHDSSIPEKMKKGISELQKNSDVVANANRSLISEVS